MAANCSELVGGSRYSRDVCGARHLRLMPLTGLLGRALLALSGHTLVADQDILFFVLSPMGLGVTLIIAAVFVATVALELASLMAAAVAAGHGSKLDTLAALRFAALRVLPVRSWRCGCSFVSSSSSCRFSL